MYVYKYIYRERERKRERERGRERLLRRSSYCYKFEKLSPFLIDIEDL